MEERFADEFVYHCSRAFLDSGVVPPIPCGLLHFVGVVPQIPWGRLDTADSVGILTQTQRKKYEMRAHFNSIKFKIEYSNIFIPSLLTLGHLMRCRILGVLRSF